MPLPHGYCSLEIFHNTYVTTVTTHIKTKIRTYGDKVYSNVHGLNVSEDDINDF